MTMPELWPHHGPNQVSQERARDTQCNMKVHAGVNCCFFCGYAMIYPFDGNRQDA